MDKPEALIIGINNFLGRAIFELIKNDFYITGVYNQNKDNLPPNIKLVQVDDILDLKDTNFRYIYLVSSYVPRDNAVNADEKLTEVNISLPLKVSELFPDSRILFCSSVSVYENRSISGPIEVFEKPSPYTKYALSKLWGEHIIREHRSYGIIRITSMYGVGMNTSTFLPRIAGNAVATGSVNLLGTGERIQNYIHVEDVAKIAVKTALHNDNLTVLAASDNSYSNKEVAEKIADIIPLKITFSGIDNSPSSCYDNGFTHKMIGQIYFKDIKEGLKEVTEWIRKQY